MLASINGFGPGSWKFKPGMLFGADTKWWGDDGGTRKTPHNGLDIRLYKESSGGIISLVGSSLVPSAGDGEVLTIIEDFLGYSVFVAHGLTEGGRTLVSAYGHIVPEEGLDAGARLSRGDIIGSIAEYEGMQVPPHLHFSVLILSDGFKELDWGIVENNAVFLDPLISSSSS